MKFIILIAIPFIYNDVIAQNFEDGFSDGNFTSNPPWSGDVENFLIFNLDGNNVIRLNDDEASISYLSTPSSNVIGEWEFFVRIDGSTPSNNNKAEVVVMSDKAVLTDVVNGYMIRVGETGEDVFRLIRLDEGIETTILSDTTSIKSSGAYRVRVLRDAGGLWELQVGEGYNGELKNSGNTVVDNTYAKSSYFGFKLTYTSSRTDDFYLDFKIDASPVVIHPVNIENFTRISKTEIDLSFSREINFSGISTSDFILNENTNPESFSSQGNDVLRLKFSSSFRGGENSLFVTGIESFNSDTILTDTTVTFFVFDSYETGDIIINEFLKDPPPGSGIPEYIELQNISSKYLNLKSWLIGDNKSLTQISDIDQVIHPDSFLVLTTDPVAVSSVFGEGFYLDVSLPALNNTTDQIRLFDSLGAIRDSLEYDTDWGGVDVALERRSKSVSSAERANWGDSPSFNFGTPGRKNEIEQDAIAPFIESSYLLNEETIILKYNEEIVLEPALTRENYSISNFRSIETIHVLSDSVRLLFSPVLEDGESVELIVQYQEDIFGNANDTSGVVGHTYIKIENARKGEVVVNEILYRRNDELSPEFVELYNPTDKNFDLSGWKLLDASGRGVTFSEGYVLSSKGYLVITDREDFSYSIPNGIYLSGFPSLNDNGDQIQIKNPKGISIDSLFYLDEWGGDLPGVSLERKDPISASNDPSNWVTSINEIGFTPGIQNSVFKEDINPPRIIFSTKKDTIVLVVFSEFVRITNETEAFVNGQASIVVHYESSQENELQLKWIPVSDKKSKLEVLDSNSEVVFTNLMDVRGNKASEVSSLISLPISKRSVVINEILYNPLADNDDNLPDQAEYIELYNPTNAAISLEGLSLHDAPDEDDEVRSIFPVSTRYKWIAPGAYFLIYSEDESGFFEESKIARYFGIEEQSGQFTMRADRSSLSLASSGDAIYIADSTGNVIDSVFYDENWQNPNVFDTDGVALERIDPNGPSDSASNWSSSTHPSGGTPIIENSIFQEAGSFPEDIGISFSTNPFSPDGDGFEDNLFINYKLEAADYLLRVRIFDRYGRRVRELTSGTQAGFEGSLTWDGLTDDRRKNRVGIYIVLFEAYNSTSGKNRTFKETVVLARMF
ncbi:MAG: lamin tail domain-containing protein [Balneolaceae bacterium]